MDDLISRQAAIDAFYTATADGDKAEWCECVLRNVPPFDKDINVSCKDAISRQAAIDICHKNYDGILDFKSDGRTVASSFEDIINSVPSVQPDVIHCKDCKHRPKATRADEKIFYGFSVEFPDEKCPCHCEDGWYGWYPGDDFYCGYAERRAE